MAEVIVKIPDHLVKTFCDWFSNSGEQSLFEAHSIGTWNEEQLQWLDNNTYLGVKGYGINEPIEIVEYDKETDEEL